MSQVMRVLYIFVTFFVGHFFVGVVNALKVNRTNLAGFSGPKHNGSSHRSQVAPKSLANKTSTKW